MTTRVGPVIDNVLVFVCYAKIPIIPQTIIVLSVMLMMMMMMIMMMMTMTIMMMMRR